MRPITTSSLKRLKNVVIGNPSAKLTLARDSAFIHALVGCLNHPPPPSGEPEGSQDDIRVEAAHVISSIAYGSEAALASLLRAYAIQALLRALSTQPQPISLTSALARALRVLASAIVQVAGPTLGPIRTYSPQCRSEAKIALDHLFEFDSLDVFLPLLAHSSLQASVAIAQLIGAAVCTEAHRNALIEWLPRSERHREVRSRRGWEKPGAVHVTAKNGAWIIRTLTGMIQTKDAKVQDAGLSALAALAQDNPPIATALARVPADGTPPPLALMLSLTKSRLTDVQLAASLCVTNIIRAQANNHPGMVDPAAALAVIQVLNRILISSSESPQSQTRACYTLSSLVRDEKDICLEVYHRGVLANVATLVKSITPLDKAADWDIDESESRVVLREAGLVTIASIALFDRVVKRDVADNMQLIPLIRSCLAHKSVGVRVAACQCIRALSRDAAIIRTNLTDSGAGLALYHVFKKEDEDPRVIYTALSVICNLVNDFSPLRQIMLDDGLLPRLMHLSKSGDQQIRVSVLWALKNLLCKSSLSMKRTVMTTLGWTHLSELVNDPDALVQEQAVCILRNLAEDEEGISLIFDSMGEDLLANCISAGLDSSSELATCEAAYFLGNLSNGTRAHQDILFTHPPLLDLVHACMADGKSGVRAPLVSCVLNLLTSNPRRRQELIDAGFVSTLRHLCDWTGTGGGGAAGGSVSPGGAVGGGGGGVGGGGGMGGVGAVAGMGRHVINAEDEKDAAGLARRVLDLMDSCGMGAGEF